MKNFLTLSIILVFLILSINNIQAEEDYYDKDSDSIVAPKVELSETTKEDIEAYENIKGVWIFVAISINDNQVLDFNDYNKLNNLKDFNLTSFLGKKVIIHKDFFLFFRSALYSNYIKNDNFIYFDTYNIGHLRKGFNSNNYCVYYLDSTRFNPKTGEIHEECFQIVNKDKLFFISKNGLKYTLIRNKEAKKLVKYQVVLPSIKLFMENCKIESGLIDKNIKENHIADVNLQTCNKDVENIFKENINKLTKQFESLGYEVILQNE
jgi:hypothetical protein